ncbi:peptide chain release factor N(5)-glutamine methyltransferase, partial [Akkermansia sp.]
VLHCNRTALYSRFDRPVEEAELAPLRELLKRRAAGEPLQHLLGFTEFFRRDFLTDARALIPRPETEELVEMVLKKIPDRPVRVLDMGTGSGIIGVTLALELKERAKEVVLADISPQALDLALENAMRLGARVSTVQTDLFENIHLEKPVLRPEGADSSASVPEEEEKDAGREMRFDVIVANLPYIADGEELAPEVMKDPHTALFGGPEGWEIIERFLARARDYLNENGFVALEIGHDQAAAVTQIMDGYGYNYIEVLKDMSGVARFPFGYH